MAADEVKLTFVAEVSQLRQALEKNTKLTQEQVKQMVAAVARGNSAAEAAAKKGAKAAADSMKEVQKGAAAAFGGLVNDLEDYAGALTALGPAGGAAALVIAGIGLAAVGAVTGLIALENAGEESLKSLKELEKFGLDPVDPRVAKSIAEANAAMDALGVFADQATVALAGAFAPAAIKGAQIALELAYRLQELTESFSTGADAASDFGAYVGSTLIQLILSPITALFQMAEAIGWVGEQFGFTNNILKQAGQWWDDFTFSLAASGTEGLAAAASNFEVRDSVLALGEATLKQNAYDKGATAEAEKLAKQKEELARAIEGLRDVGLDAAASNAEAEDKQARAYDKATEALSDKEKAALKLAKTLGDVAAQEEIVEAAAVSAYQVQSENQVELAKIMESAADKERARLIAIAKLQKYSADEQLAIVQETYAAELAELESLRSAQKANLEQVMGDEELSASQREERAAALAEGLIQIEGEITDVKLESIQKTTEAQKAAAAEQIEIAKDALENVQLIYGSIADSITQLAEVQIAAHQQNIEGLRDERSEAKQIYLDAKESYIANRGKMSDADRKAAKAELRLLKSGYISKKEVINASIEEQKKAALTAFRIQQGAALGEAGVAAALAAIAMLPHLAYLTYGAPAAAAGIAAIGFAASAAAIMSEPPPKFHTGKSPVEMPAMLDRQEAVLNRRAVSDLGSETIARANQGTLGGNGGGGVMQTAIYLNDRILDTITANGIMRGSQSRLAVAAVARSANYRGGYK